MNNLEENKEVYYSSIPNYLINSYIETKRFINFLENNDNHCYWMIFSDYCFSSATSNKSSVITATIIPFSDYKWIETYCSLSKLKTKLDIKKSYINEKHLDFIKFIGLIPAFHISLKLDKGLDYYNNEKMNDKQFFLQYFESIKYFYNKNIHYGVSQPNKYMNINNIEKIIMQLGKNPKLKIFKQAQVISALISSISKMIIDSTQVECKILWCSDRDDTLNYLQSTISAPFIFDMIRYDTLRLEPKKNNYHLDFIRKHTDGFDELIRIPDYIAGTISDIDLERVTVSHEKFLPVIYSFLTNSNKNLVLSIKNNLNKIELKKYDFEKVSLNEPSWGKYKKNKFR